MLLIDQQATLASIPSLLPPDAETRREALNVVKQIVAASGERSAEDEKRFEEIGRLFGIREEGSMVEFPQIRKEFAAKAS
jgi:hypothetical protein